MARAPGQRLVGGGGKPLQNDCKEFLLLLRVEYALDREEMGNHLSLRSRLQATYFIQNAVDASGVQPLFGQGLRQLCPCDDELRRKRVKLRVKRSTVHVKLCGLFRRECKLSFHLLKPLVAPVGGRRRLCAAPTVVEQRTECNEIDDC